MSQPTAKQLRTYLAVIDTGSVSAAARSLGLTQPAASQQVHELERHLGVRLLDRAGGRSLPTAAGEAILDAARRSLAAVDDVTAAAAAFRSGEQGRVRLGTGATACIYLLPPVLSALRRRMPGIDIIVATGNTEEMVRRVEDGALDLALVTLPAPRSRAIFVRPLLDDPLVALIPEEAAVAGRARSARPADLLALPLILYEPGATLRRLLDDWFALGGATARPVMELGSVEAIKGLVGSGLGCSILPAIAVRGGVAGAVVRPLKPGLRRQLALVLRKEKLIDRGLRACLDALETIALRPAAATGQGGPR